MNNATKLWGLIRGLQLAIKNDFTKIIIEGDSQIIINLAVHNFKWSEPGKNVA
jgi:ribonuclease HI